MRKLSLILVALVLGACSWEGERTYTVDELVADEILLADQIVKCRNNPGELADTPNCRNAEAANGRVRLDRMKKALGG
jgi:hypothetical protein